MPLNKETDLNFKLNNSRTKLSFFFFFNVGEMLSYGQSQCLGFVGLRLSSGSLWVIYTGPAYGY